MDNNSYLKPGLQRQLFILLFYSTGIQSAPRVQFQQMSYRLILAPVTASITLERGAAVIFRRNLQKQNPKKDIGKYNEVGNC